MTKKIGSLFLLISLVLLYLGLIYYNHVRDEKSILAKQTLGSVKSKLEELNRLVPKVDKPSSNILSLSAEKSSGQTLSLALDDKTDRAETKPSIVTNIESSSALIRFLKNSYPETKWEISHSAIKSKVIIALENPLVDFGLYPNKENDFLTGLLAVLEIPLDQVMLMDFGISDNISLNKSESIESFVNSKKVRKVDSRVYIQKYKTYKVIGASLVFDYRKSDNALLLINSKLVNIGTPDLSIQISSDEVVKKMKALFLNAQIEIARTPSILALANKKSELVWPVYIKTVEGLNQKQFVSAISGRMLQQIKLDSR